VKPNLAQAASRDTINTVQTLHDIAKLAETFTAKKTSERPELVSTFVDQLDNEGIGSESSMIISRNDASKGVAIWNSATYLKTGNGVSAELFAAGRSGRYICSV